MGNRLSYWPYNKYYDPENKYGDNYSGPYVHPDIIDFEKEIEEKYKNKSLIENNLEKMKKFHDRECLGIRKKIGDKFEQKYTYFTYADVHKMSLNFAKNVHEKN